jgi:hypothetical protein
MVIFGRAAAYSVGPVGVAGTGTFRALVEDQYQGAIRQEVAARETIKIPHSLNSEPAGTALIGKRGIEETVTKHPFPLAQRRADRLLDVLEWLRLPRFRPARG